MRRTSFQTHAGNFFTYNFCNPHLDIVENVHNIIVVITADIRQIIELCLSYIVGTEFTLKNYRQTELLNHEITDILLDKTSQVRPSSFFGRGDKVLTNFMPAR